jgi:septum formation protein
MSAAKHRIILASGSQSRRQLLAGAGVAFDAVPADVHERALRDAALAKDAATSPGALAVMLARAKAEEVAARNPGATVIGADQILALGPRFFEKPKDMAEARAHLLAMRGHIHQLHGGVAVIAPGRPLWTHEAISHMTMRAFTPDFLEHYLATAGPQICQSVGAYQLEGLGIQLFEHIEGDYFAILGLALAPVLAHLRALGALPK